MRRLRFTTRNLAGLAAVSVAALALPAGAAGATAPGTRAPAARQAVVAGALARGMTSVTGPAGSPLTDLGKLAQLVNSSTGATQLTKSVRTELQQVISFAEKSLRAGNDCVAIRVADALRAPLQSPRSYKAGRIGTFGRELDALVVTTDRDIMATGKVKACVLAGHLTPAVKPQKVGPPVKLVPNSGPAEDGSLASALLLGKNDPRFLKPGPVTTVLGVDGKPVEGHPLPAIDPLRVYQRTDTTLPTNGFPQEVQVADGGGVVLASGNGGAFYSTDHGTSFHSMSPATVFGAFQGGFCCDTQLRYAPGVRRFFWLLQGNGTSADPNNNSYVLAVASPQDILDAVAAHRPVEQAWHIYRLTRSLFGETHTWFDFPTMSVGNHALYLGWDRVDAGVIMARLNLAQLAAGGSVSIYYFTQNSDTFRQLAQDSGAAGYWISNSGDAGATAAADYIQESSGLMFRALLPHTAIPDRACGASETVGTCGYTSLTPLGEDWTFRVAGPAVKAATVRGNQLWVGWTAARGYADQTTNAFSQPHIQYAAFTIPLTPAGMIASGGGTTWPAAIEGNVQNPAYAMVDPAFATSSTGDVGISFSIGGPGIPPTPVAGVLYPGTAAPQVQVVISADSVNTGGDRTQGDYSSIQPAYPNSARFVTAGYVDRLISDLPVNHWGYMCFGLSATVPQPGDHC